MLIGEICKKTDLSRDTIRFYEKKGLLQVDRSKSEYNNYKEYTNEHVETLILIKKAKRFGFTLTEIGSLLELVNNNLATCTTLRMMVKDKILDIDKRIADLIDMKNLILASLSSAEETCLTNTESNYCKQLNETNKGVRLT